MISGSSVSHVAFKEDFFFPRGVGSSLAWSFHLPLDSLQFDD